MSRDANVTITKVDVLFGNLVGFLVKVSFAIPAAIMVFVI